MIIGDIRNTYIVYSAGEEQPWAATESCVAKNFQLVAVAATNSGAEQIAGMFQAVAPLLWGERIFSPLPSEKSHCCPFLDKLVISKSPILIHLGLKTLITLTTLTCAFVLNQEDPSWWQQLHLLRQRRSFRFSLLLLLLCFFLVGFFLISFLF